MSEVPPSNGVNHFNIHTSGRYYAGHDHSKQTTNHGTVHYYGNGADNGTMIPESQFQHQGQRSEVNSGGNQGTTGTDGASQSMQLQHDPSHSSSSQIAPSTRTGRPDDINEAGQHRALATQNPPATAGSRSDGIALEGEIRTLQGRLMDLQRQFGNGGAAPARSPPPGPDPTALDDSDER